MFNEKDMNRKALNILQLKKILKAYALVLFQFLIFVLD